MSRFEFLAVLVSIILSFGIIRLLDSLPTVLERERGYAIHGLWVVFVLWQHVQYWWVFWVYSALPEWIYSHFLLVLTSPLLLYSLASTIVPRDAASVASWRDHFYRVRSRFFALLACWMVVVVVAAVVVLAQPALGPFRAAQASFVGLLVLGALWAKPWYHGFLIAFCLCVAVVFVTVTFSQVGPAGP